jgi:D-alanyl-lipoteichoic acid acyltransferase DltB (MBOAT superfamily)
MLFNSISFLVFLPLVLLGANTLPGRWRNLFLLGASYVFYGAWDWRFLLLLWATTGVDYVAARQIAASAAPRRRRAFLLLSLGTNLTVLGFFKYYDFFVQSGAQLLGAIGLPVSPWTLTVILPVGISFYTFQSMAYVIDVYRGQLAAVTDWRDYALAVAYFPQLVAGPIERMGHLLPQLQRRSAPPAERVQVGLTLMAIGFAKKVLIADLLAPEVDRIFSHPDAMSSGLLLKGAYCFALQIYGDFSGYSDIARGVSELLGVQLIKNFEQPYLSQSITEFWRRWHISLSSWLRDYLYIPLGGNRRGAARTYRNLMLTMLIGGLWHGANWTFVVWGGLHGAFLAVERWFGVAGQRPRWAAGGVTGVLGAAARTLLTFHLVTVAWIFFRAPSIGTAASYLAHLFRFEHLGEVGAVPFVAAAAVLAIDIPQYASGRHTVLQRLPWWVQSPLYATLCLALILYGGSEVPFIYFQF